MVERQRKPAKAGRHSLAFFVRDAAGHMPLMEVKTPTGTMVVSTKGTTLLDLVAYHRRAGGLGNVATIVAELAAGLEFKDLTLAAKRNESAILQRLGYLLELTGWPDAALEVENLLRHRHHSVVKLRSDLPGSGAIMSKRWSLWINDQIEADI